MQDDAMNTAVDAALQRHVRSLALQALQTAPCYTLNDIILRDVLDKFGVRLSHEKQRVVFG
jgi:hypothetical protein